MRRGYGPVLPPFRAHTVPSGGPSGTFRAFSGHLFVLRMRVQCSNLTPVAKLWNSSPSARKNYGEGLDSGEFW